MSVLPADQATVHEMHGASFASYVSPAQGSTELCAWRLEVAPGIPGQQHVVTREEVLLILDGHPTVTVDGAADRVGPGDVVVVPANSAFRLDNDAADPATAWVTTSVGLEAVLDDGGRISPPWTR